MAQSAGKTADETTGMPPFCFESYRVLLPSIAGIALAAAAVNLTIQQAHGTTGVSTYDGWSLVAASIVVGAIFLSTIFVKRFPKAAISLGVFLSIHIGGLSALVLGAADAAVIPLAAPVDLLLQAGVTMGATLLQFYWLRKLRGTSAQAVVVVVFAALAASEFITFALSFAPVGARHLTCVALMFLQFAPVRASRSLGLPSDSFPAVSESYFGTDENHFSNRSFLVVAALGIWLISIPIGMGRGFSTGQPVHLDLLPRALVLAAVTVVSALWVRFALASRMRALTTSIWVVMELLLGAGTILFALLPTDPSPGAALVLASSLVLQAFVWYMTIAFISFGWRDPYYYACAAWIAMNLLTVAGMHVDALITRLVPSNVAAIIAFMGFFVLVGAQVVFTRLLAAPSEQGEVQAAADLAAAKAAAAGAEGPGHITEDDVRRIPLMGVLAISPQAETPLPSKTPDVHIATSVLEIGQRFGLTGREVEVLTLYALGHTQARVSEELQLSTNTVHTHIKRIYEKTDLHSRQEILDYISEYGGRA